VNEVVVAGSDRDRMGEAVSRESLDQMAPEETGAAGDENARVGVQQCLQWFGSTQSPPLLRSSSSGHDDVAPLRLDPPLRLTDDALATRGKEVQVTPASPVPPPVTIITVVRNARATLERTILSVLAQRHPDLAYLIIDGSSTDGTLEVIRRHHSRLRWLSEPDRGLYDAMNKGVGLVTDRGRYVMFLNGDDTFAADDAVARLLGGAEGEDLVYGLLERHDESTGYRDVVGGELPRRRLTYGMIPHQALFCRRRVFDDLGGFDLRYRIAADYDWLTRAYARPGLSRRFVPVVVSVMKRGGLSDRLYPRLVRERWDIVRRHRGRADLVAYSLWAAVVEYPRFLAQRILRRLGLLDRVRRLRRRRSGRVQQDAARG
jgi:glycosyltransferase involved in cell wall biosynthesis